MPRPTVLITALFLLITTLLPVTQPVPVNAATPVPAGWKDTGGTVTTSFINGLKCFDGSHPGILRSSNLHPENGEAATTELNLATGRTTTLNWNFNACNEANGLFYSSNYEADTAVLYSNLYPDGKPLQHAPTYFAADGTLQTYSLHLTPLGQYGWQGYDSRLYASADGGLTWVERGQQLNNRIESLAVSPVDGRALYALVGDKRDGSSASYSLYFSSDAGISWEKRYQNSASACYPGPGINIFSPDANTVPVNTVQLAIGNRCGGSGNATDYFISVDGGRTFKPYGSYSEGGNVSLVYSNQGLFRLTNYYYPAPDKFVLETSPDGGQNWQKLNLPYTPPTCNPETPDLCTFPVLRNIPNAPSNLLMHNEKAFGDLWYSQDGARTWQDLGPNPEVVLVTPYAPHNLVGFKDNHAYTLALPKADKTKTAGVNPNEAPGSVYFPETRHTMPFMFRKYWEDKGGLAQFGYPKTDPFREVNPSDGKIYTVQYFERARFEYHPENAGTQYEILLGLLGNQLTAPQKAQGSGAFNYFQDAHYPGGTYFSETGHNLRNSFKAYWEANGGLAIYGFPISEEFYEVNPDDGKTYVVQYFERNRFEWHPENAGTRYEVLLGLLGNALLRDKGWL